MQTDWQRTLMTRRLVLRVPAPRDAPSLVRLLSNYLVSGRTGVIPYPYCAHHAHVWIAHVLGHPGDFARLITLRSNPKIVVGAVGARSLDSPSPAVGYWIAEHFWGRGYATEALVALVSALFESHTVGCLKATIAIGNARSARVLHKAGFRRLMRRGISMSRARRRKLPVEYFDLTRERWSKITRVCSDAGGRATSA
jgi:[ribosomal protein S5]-alanine N-acetyltransferase